MLNAGGRMRYGILYDLPDCDHEVAPTEEI